jgi:hypothetical protein
MNLTMTRGRRILAGGFLLLLLPSLAIGKLVAISWRDFLAHSAVVVRARLVAGEVRSLGVGHARFAVTKVLRGALDDQEVSISWTSEVHDQAATNLGGEYILFLQRDNLGSLQPASYGRSLWPIDWYLLPSGESKQLIEYRHPVSMVTLPDSMIVAIQVAESGPGSSHCTVRGIDPTVVEEEVRDAR